MPSSASGGSRSAVNAIRVLFLAIGVTAGVLGALGMYGLLKAEAAKGGRFDPWDVAYYTWQLYVLGAEPFQSRGPYDLRLELARIMAPLFTLSAVAEAVRLLLAGELRRVRARIAGRHAVVVGDTPFAAALAEHLFDEDWKVVVVRSHPLGPLELRRWRMLGVPGDAAKPGVLRGAGIRRAKRVYVCGGDDEGNHAATAAASRLLAAKAAARQKRSPLGFVRRLLRPNWLPPWIYVQVNQQQMCHALQARRLGAAGSNQFRLDYFHVDDVAARALYRRHPPRPAAGRPTRILVAGDGSFRRVLLTETARYWRDHVAPLPLRIDVVGDGAAETVATLDARFPFLSGAAELVTHDGDFPDWYATQPPDSRFDRIYLCYGDERRSFDLALTRPDLWRAVSEAVFVPTYGNSALADAFHGGRSDLLDEVGGRLRVYPVATEACNPELISDDLTERLARRTHEDYLRTAPPRDTPAFRDWDKLPESMQNANRAQAQGIAGKMLALHCVISVRQGDGETLQDKDIERLAMMEHQRWCDERRGRGWRYGPERSDRRRRHPVLRAWHDIDEESRAKTRNAVRGMPDMLADEGFAIVQLPIVRVGITGHINLTDATADLVYAELVEHLRRFADRNVVGVTCLAGGADQVFAKAVQDIGGRYDVILPAPDYRTKIRPEDRRQYDELLKGANLVSDAGYAKSGPEAYLAASEAMVKQVTHLFAAWDGTPEGRPGGTAHVVRLAREQGIDVTVVWPDGAERRT